MAGLGIVDFAPAIEISLIGVAVEAREHHFDDLKIAAPGRRVLSLSEALPAIGQRAEPRQGKKRAVKEFQGAWSGHRACLRISETRKVLMLYL